ncbi:hypothetical protein NDU88_003869 [Pleurodeles waltl]|uniref:Uncharacterized protein n=1 Tax=Pleurodeles waltl TaxID=8319 RepID=A0AAV7VIJ5_PLEWA|nr:hypothetical protein NDU88_003869 [Pleurodeles waltl]
MQPATEHQPLVFIGRRRPMISALRATLSICTVHPPHPPAVIGSESISNMPASKSQAHWLCGAKKGPKGPKGAPRTSTPGNAEQSPRGAFRFPDAPSPSVNSDQREKDEDGREWGAHTLGVVEEARTGKSEEQEKAEGRGAADDGTEAVASETL